MKWENKSSPHRQTRISFQEPLRVCSRVRMHMSSYCPACVECHREEPQVLMSRDVSWHPARAFVCHWKLPWGRSCMHTCVLPTKAASTSVNFQQKYDYGKKINNLIENHWGAESAELRTVHIITSREQLRHSKPFPELTHGIKIAWQPQGVTC